MATVLIIGASKGIGLETAHLLRQRGHTVIGTSRTPADDHLLRLDVTSSESIEQFMTLLGQQPVDSMIYSAGYDLYSAAEDTTMDKLIAQLDANFMGAVRMTQAILPQMRRQGHGKLIYLSSLGGLSALPFNSAYSASKFALEGYAESLRYELLPHDIYVSLIAPGQVRTDTLSTSIQNLEGESIYGVSSARLAQNARIAGEKASLSPQQVAAAVVQVVESHRPRLRYVIGTQARMVLSMRTLMPKSFFERFILHRFVYPLL